MRIPSAEKWTALTGRWAALADRWTGMPGLVLLLTLGPAVPSAMALPAPEEMQLETSVDRDSVLIADPIVYIIDVWAPPGVLVEPPQPAQQLGPFEVRDVEFLPPEDQAGSLPGPSSGKTPGRNRAGQPPAKSAGGPLRTRIRWHLVPYQTGRLEIPAVEIVLTGTTAIQAAGIDTAGAGAAGAGALGAADTLRTEPYAIEVTSLEPDLQGDIRDIKPPEELPRGWAWIGWLIGGLVLLAAGLWLLRRLRRRGLQRDLKEIPYQGPLQPAHRIALEELDRIAALHLLGKGMVKEYYIQTSDAIRRYAEGRYAIGAMELTTWELIGEMKRTAVPDDDSDIFRIFLEECDLVKFARYIPPAEVRETLLDRARRLVLATRIPERPRAPEKAPALQADTRPAGIPES